MVCRCLFAFGLFLLMAANENSWAQEIKTKFEIAPGKPYPDFCLPNIESGQPTTLSSFRGKKVLLLHFASW